MADGAQGNEILLRIVPEQAARLNVMGLKIGSENRNVVTANHRVARLRGAAFCMLLHRVSTDVSWSGRVSPTAGHQPSAEECLIPT